MPNEEHFNILTVAGEWSGTFRHAGTVQCRTGMASDMEYKDVFYANAARPNSTGDFL